MAKKFVEVTGLNNVFNASSATELDLTSIKSDVSTKVNSNSILFMTADNSDELYGFPENSRYIWTRNKLYPTNDSSSSIISEVVSTIPNVSIYITPSILIEDKTSASGNSFVIDPNKMYMFGERTTLTISSLNPGDTSIVNEYMFLFTSGNTATTLYVPNTVVWLKDPDISTGKKYAVSIENNLGIIGEWNNE